MDPSGFAFGKDPEIKSWDDNENEGRSSEANLSYVIPGLDPGIHGRSRAPSGSMDPRVKPGDDLRKRTYSPTAATASVTRQTTALRRSLSSSSRVVWTA